MDLFLLEYLEKNLEISVSIPQVGLGLGFTTAAMRVLWNHLMGF